MMQLSLEKMQRVTVEGTKSEFDQMIRSIDQLYSLCVNNQIELDQHQEIFAFKNNLVMLQKEMD